MNSISNFNNYDFIKLDQLNILSDKKIVILYARFMHSTGSTWTLDTHSHSFYELHFSLNGSCNVIIQNSQNTILDVGKHLLIHPNTNHKFTNFSDDFFRLSIAFDIQHEENILVENDKYLLGNSSEKILFLLQQMISEYNKRDLGYKSIVNFHIQTALIEILRLHPYILYGHKLQSNTVRSSLHSVLRFIRNNISTPITATDVANQVNLSSRQLNRIFTTNLNMTVAEFIRNERILRVQEHLKKTNLTLPEIAILTGFNDEYVLCKSFKNIMGISPGKYRSNYKKKGNEKIQ